jgi:hypothetical protein
MRLVFAAAAAALGLAACGPSEPAADTASTAPAAADTAAPAPAPPAASATLPDGPAAGKWKMTITAMGQTLPPTEVCYEKQVSLEEAEKMQQQAGVSCSEQSYRKDGDAWVGHSVCTMEAGPAGPIKVTTDTKVTGDFASKYAMEIASKMDPAPMPSMADQKMTITAERLGDC